MRAPKQFIGGRIVGGYSLHAQEQPELCDRKCPEPRCVDCCGVTDEVDIMECPKCGKQWSGPCSFDEDYS